MSTQPPWEELYQAVIVEHSKHPRNRRTIPGATGREEGHSPLCGDRITVEVIVDGEGRIVDVGFSGHGCAISQSSASLMTEAVRGQTRDEALALTKRFLAMATAKGDALPPADLGPLRAMAGVRRFPMRVKCATLAWHALEGALAQLGETAEKPKD